MLAFQFKNRKMLNEFSNQSANYPSSIRHQALVTCKTQNSCSFVRIWLPIFINECGSYQYGDLCINYTISNVWNLKLPIETSNIYTFKGSKYSLVPIDVPPLINFLIFFHPGHSYSNPPAIKFLKHNPPKTKIFRSFYFSLEL